MLKLHSLILTLLYYASSCKWTKSSYFYTQSYIVSTTYASAIYYQGYLQINGAPLQVNYYNIILSFNYFSYSRSSNSTSVTGLSMFLNDYDTTWFQVYYSYTTNNLISEVPFTYLIYDMNLAGISNNYCYCYGYTSSSSTNYTSISSYTLNSSIVPAMFLTYFYVYHHANSTYTELSSPYYFDTSSGAVNFTCQFSNVYNLNLQVNILFIDTDIFRDSYAIVVDYGTLSGSSTHMDAAPLDPQLFTADSFISYSNFSVPMYTSTTFTLQFDGSLTIDSGSLTSLNATYINFRTQYCTLSGYPYYIQSTSSCASSCSAGTYPNTTLMDCITCNYTCAECTENFNCTVCDADNFREKTGKSCVCKEGYFDNKVALCVKCSANCLTCTSTTACTKCISTNISYSSFGNTYNTTYIVDSNKQCTLCTSLMTNCIACTAYNQCTSCVIANFTVSADKSTCVCDTTNQYFAKSSNCTLCKDIILGCLTCSSNTTCTACDTSKNFVLSGASCACKTNYSLINSMCCHYSCTACENSSDTCISCNTGGYRELVSNTCPCKAKYYDNGVSACPSCMIVCATCNAGSTCQTCNNGNNLTLVNNNCVCTNANYVLITDYCKLCAELIPNCIACVNYTTCKTCNTPNYTLASTNLSCLCNNALQYFLLGSTCALCKDYIHACTNCSSATTCLTCISPNYTLSSDSTTCPCNQVSNYFRIGLDCPFCPDIIRGCVTCTSNTTCSLCYANNYTLGSGGYTCNCNEPLQYFAWNLDCPFCRDLIIGCINCTTNSTCFQCDAVGFFRSEGDRCVCIDGYFLSGVVCLPCEVSCLTCVTTATFCLTCNTTALRLFDNNNCICLEPFSDCRTSGLDACDNRTCSYLTETKITIVAMIKNPSQNSLTFKISLTPVITYFDGFNFDDIFTLGLPDGTDITLSYSDGYVQAEVDYYQNLQGNWTDIIMNINTTGPWYFELAPQAITHYQIAPTNNLASNVYPQQLYDTNSQLETVVTIVAALALLVYFVGLISAKIVASEMIGVVQIAYFGLFIVNHSDPLIFSLNKLQMANGINTLLDTTQQKTPNRIYSVGYTPSAISNLNIMLIFLILPPIISSFLYLIHKKSTKYRIVMGRAWKLALGEWYLSAFLFVIYNYSSSLITVFLFSDMSSIQFYFSVIQEIVLSGIFGFLLWMFIKKDKTWLGEYKESFNWNAFSGMYYLLPIFQRFVVGALLTAASMSFASGIISVVIVIAGLIIVAIKHPFIQKYQNYRSIATSTYSTLIMSIYIALSIYGPSKGQSLFTYAPYAIILILILNLITSLVFIILWFYHKLKNIKIQKSNEIQEANDQKLYQDMSKNIEKLVKETKKKSVNNKSMLYRVGKMGKKNQLMLDMKPEVNLNSDRMKKGLVESQMNNSYYGEE